MSVKLLVPSAGSATWSMLPITGVDCSVLVIDGIPFQWSIHRLGWQQLGRQKNSPQSPSSRGLNVPFHLCSWSGWRVGHCRTFPLVCTCPQFCHGKKNTSWLRKWQYLNDVSESSLQLYSRSQVKRARICRHRAIKYHDGHHITGKLILDLIATELADSFALEIQLAIKAGKMTTYIYQQSAKISRTRMPWQIRRGNSGSWQIYCRYRRLWVTTDWLPGLHSTLQSCLAERQYIKVAEANLSQFGMFLNLS